MRPSTYTHQRFPDTLEAILSTWASVVFPTTFKALLGEQSPFH